MHDQYKIGREVLQGAFEQTSIRGLAEQVNEGGSFINNPTLKN
jgi:hypothetical protein